MKTNQVITVDLGIGVIELDHKYYFGNAHQVIDMGNIIRVKKGLKPISLENILQRQEFWAFVLATATLLKNKENFNSLGSKDLKNTPIIDPKDIVVSNFAEIEKHLDKSGNVLYSKLIKQFPEVIKSKRGKHGGTWMHLNLLLRLGAICDPDLEARIYDYIVESKILLFRDMGGDEFKKLNQLIYTLPDRQDKDNKGCYITISRMIRNRLNIKDTKGYNKQEHNSWVQQQRQRLIDHLCSGIEMKVINNFDILREWVNKLPLSEHF